MPNRAPRRMLRSSLFCAVLVGQVFALSLRGEAAPAATDNRADKFLIVDCLLPAQIRQLGRNMTFLAPRQALRTSADECATRGGEFTRADAGGAAGLKMWLPAAEKGDPAAQLYVGEIFERGLAGQPDYAAAAVWYRRAVDLGNSQAAINLGALLEQGLGGPRDPVEAAKLFRRAAGLPEELPGDQQKIQELTSQLATANQSNAEKQKQLDQQAKELNDLRRMLRQRQSDLKQDKDALKDLQARLAKSRQAAPAAGEQATKDLDRALAERERELAQSKTSIAALQAKLSALENAPKQQAADPAELDKLRGELGGARAAMEKAERDADGLKKQLAVLQASNAQREQAAKELNKALSERERALAQSQTSIAALQAKLTALENAPKQQAPDPAELDKLRGELSGARTAMEKVQGDANGLKKQLADLQTNSASREHALNDTVVRLEEEIKTRQAGIAAKDSEIEALKGKLASLETSRSNQPAEARSVGNEPAAPAPSLPLETFGRYHALVIGISDYQRLKKLETPVKDATAVAEILRKDYGFEVVTLLDAAADRYHILSELNKLRETLTEKDNLLVYYAGHGELDRVNQRGNWLPVDAEPDSTANWISNIQITDILNTIAARQILVIADSCYSGILTRGVATAMQRTQSGVDRTNWYKIMISKPSRVALTSGGLEPVADSNGGNHSLFASILLKVLHGNASVMSAQEVYTQIQPAVATKMDDARMHQVPEYAPIKMAGHEAGDFLFVRHQTVAQ